MAPKSGNNSNEMKLSSLPSTVSDTKPSESTVDFLFKNLLPKRIEEQKYLVKTINCIYQLNLTRDSKIISIWTLDVKNENGSIYSGPPKNCKPDCSITINENDALHLLDGTLDPGKAFLGGKLKISGNLMAAHKFQQFWSEEMVKGSQKRISELMPQNSNDSSKDAQIVTNIDSGKDEALLQSIPIDGLKSDIVFNIIKMRMNEEPELVKAMKFVIQFNITRNGQTIAVWTADTKVSGGHVYRSAAKGNADAVLTVEDENYVKILFGKLNPQRAFMTGKIKVRGNILLLQKLDTFWNQVQGSRNDPELPLVKQLMLSSPLIPGLRSETIIFDLIQKLVKLPNLLNEGTIVQIDITKDAKLASTWMVKFNGGENKIVLERGNNTPINCDIGLTIDDNDFVRLSYNTIKLKDAIDSGRVKYRGDFSLVNSLSKIFTTPLIKSKL